MKKIILVLFVICFVMSFGEDTKIEKGDEKITTRGVDVKYPPYPDVWDFEIPLTKGDYKYLNTKRDRYIPLYNVKNNVAEVYLTENRDIALLFRHFKNFKSNILTTTNHLFFKNQNFLESVDNGKKLNLSEMDLEENNKKISSCIGDEEDKVRMVFSSYVEIKDNSGNSTRKTIVYLLDKPIRVENQSPYFPQKNLYINTKIIELKDIEFVKLEDNTFLLLAGDIAVRFDKKLNSKSKIINNKLFLLDQDIVEKIRIEAEDDNQIFVDKLYKEILKIKKKKGV